MGLRETLEAATPGGKPPYRIAGIPAGIISADDYDVTDEALAFLALAPELAALALEMGEALSNPWTCSPDCLAFQGYGHHVMCIDKRPELLARLDRLGKEQT